jgi:hypothetical protein
MAALLSSCLASGCASVFWSCGASMDGDALSPPQRAAVARAINVR